MLRMNFKKTVPVPMQLALNPDEISDGDRVWEMFPHGTDDFSADKPGERTKVTWRVATELQELKVYGAQAIPRRSCVPHLTHGPDPEPISPPTVKPKALNWCREQGGPPIEAG
jgi:hypothetical protein